MLVGINPDWIKVKIKVNTSKIYLGIKVYMRFSGNPVEETYSREGTWRDMIADLLPELKILDGNYLPCL